MAPETPAVEGDVLPPSLADGNSAAKVEKVVLTSMTTVREEMQRIYRLARRGKIRIDEATRLVYVLDKIMTAYRQEREIEDLERQYAEAFSGLVVRLAPPKEQRESTK